MTDDERYRVIAESIAEVQALGGSIERGSWGNWKRARTDGVSSAIRCCPIGAMLIFRAPLDMLRTSENLAATVLGVEVDWIAGFIGAVDQRPHFRASNGVFEAGYAVGQRVLVLLGWRNGHE